MADWSHPTLEEVRREMSRTNLEEVRTKMHKEVETLMTKCGLYFRIFSRVKTDKSLTMKLQTGKYENGGKLVQDVVGVRIVCYFDDDIKVCENILNENFDVEEWSKNEHSVDSFHSRKHNAVARVKSPLQGIFRSGIGQMPVDTTFEIQLRTMLFEGWHEIEHDMRYKNCKQGDGRIFSGNEELSRMMNGLLATLELNDWTLVQIFDELAYFHYKNRNWPQMLRTKFRVTIEEEEIAAELLDILNSYDEEYNGIVGKKFFKCPRAEFISALLKERTAVNYRLTSHTVLYVMNKHIVRNKGIEEYFQRNPLQSLRFYIPRLARPKEHIMCNEWIEGITQGEVFDRSVQLVYGWVRLKLSEVFGNLPRHAGDRININRSCPGYMINFYYDREQQNMELYVEHPDMERPAVFWRINAMIEHKVFHTAVIYYAPEYIAELPYRTIPGFIGRVREIVTNGKNLENQKNA